MNFEQARFNMVQQQVRTWEVLSANVLDLLQQLPREDFVEPQYRKLAYADTMLPIRHGEVMMKPVVEGRVLQALEIKPTDQVLEIGTGTGYMTACLASMAEAVTSVDLHQDFIDAATRRLAALQLENVELQTGNAVSGWQPNRVFDVVAVTGAVHEIPEQWFDWLADGGRMFVIAGDSPAMEALLIRRDSAGRLVTESLFETDLPHLAGASKPEALAL